MVTVFTELVPTIDFMKHNQSDQYFMREANNF